MCHVFSCSVFEPRLGVILSYISLSVLHFFFKFHSALFQTSSLGGCHTFHGALLVDSASSVTFATFIVRFFLQWFLVRFHPKCYL